MLDIKDIKVGDSIRVVEKYNPDKYGVWCDNWQDMPMNNSIGKTYNIISIYTPIPSISSISSNSDYRIKLDTSKDQVVTKDYNFPICVLEKVLLLEEIQQENKQQQEFNELLGWIITRNNKT